MREYDAAAKYVSGQRVLHDGKVWEAQRGASGVAPPEWPWQPVDPVLFELIIRNDNQAVTASGSTPTLRVPVPILVTGLRMAVATPGSGSTTMTVTADGLPILSAPLAVPAGAYTSGFVAHDTFAEEHTITDASVVEVDVLTAGAGAKGLRLWIIGVRP